MTAPSASGTDLVAQARLFAPGQRLGWIFRDRNQFTQPFTEPAPQPQPVPERLLHEEHRARQRHNKWVCVTWRICRKIIKLSVLIGAAWKIFDNVFESVDPFDVYGEIKDFDKEALSLILVVGVITIGTGGAIIGLSKLALSRKMNTIVQAQQELEFAHQRGTDDWHQRKTAYEQAEKTKIDQLVEWGAVQTPTGCRRLDIFGGNLWSWQAFLTVYGTSTLTARPVIVIDLSRENVSGELVHITRAAGVSVDAQILPDHLAHTTLLSGLPAQHIVDTLIESMHGDDPPTRHVTTAAGILESSPHSAKH